MSSELSDTRTRILEATWQLMEQRQGQGISMSGIAKATGLSRQALYLHFASRLELVAATVHYVDQVKGLDARLAQFELARNGVEQLHACVTIWAGYIPEIHGLAKALLAMREGDDASAEVWDACMSTLRNYCGRAIASLQEEQRLAPPWTLATATEMLWSLLSFQNWEQLTVDCGWSPTRYAEHMQLVVGRVFVRGASIQ